MHKYLFQIYILIFVVFIEGLTNATKLCAARYFCRRNATSGTPNQGEDANICPQGHYCPDGTGEPEKCPAGTFTNQTGKLNTKIIFPSSSIFPDFYRKFFCISFTPLLWCFG